MCLGAINGNPLRLLWEVLWTRFLSFSRAFSLGSHGVQSPALQARKSSHHHLLLIRLLASSQTLAHPHGRTTAFCRSVQFLLTLAKRRKAIDKCFSPPLCVLQCCLVIQAGEPTCWSPSFYARANLGVNTSLGCTSCSQVLFRMA